MVYCHRPLEREPPPNLLKPIPTQVPSSSPPLLIPSPGPRALGSPGDQAQQCRRARGQSGARKAPTETSGATENVAGHLLDAPVPQKLLFSFLLLHHGSRRPAAALTSSSSPFLRQLQELAADFYFLPKFFPFFRNFLKNSARPCHFRAAAVPTSKAESLSPLKKHDVTFPAGTASQRMMMVLIKWVNASPGLSLKRLLLSVLFYF